MNLCKRYELRDSQDWAVWRGEDPVTQELFLVKSVKLDSPYGERLRARLRQEFQFLDGLNSPCFLRPARLDAGGSFALFEDVQGSLAQYLRRQGPLSPPLVANV